MKKLLGLISLLLLFHISYGQENNNTELFFIRHAEKVRSGSKDPALTKIGQERAIYWAEVFKDVKFDAVYSTQTLRTVSTALPTSGQCDVELSIYDAKTIDIKAIADKHKGESVLIVGHSNTTPALVNTLIGEEKYEEIKSNNNSNLYIVNYHTENSKVTLLHIDLPK